MASGSNTNNDDVNNNNVDVAPPFTLNTGGPVLMPVDDNDQPIPETDHRDGRETSPESDDEDAVQFLSERKKGKQSQIAPGKSVTTPQPNSPRVTENAALLDALRETIRTVNEQNNRIRALEDGQRQILGPVLERIQPQVQKRNRTPPREDSVARTNKRGKAVALVEQRPRSPPRRKEILLGGMTQGSRGDDYQYRRENSPRREETPTNSPGWSDDEVYKGPLSKQIMDLELPRALQKPPQLGKHDGLTDPDIHIQNIDVILNYQAVRGGIKYRIFPTTLVEGAMAWYISLPQGSITSWKDLCKQFTSHFTASRKHPKTEANLEAVRQGPNETLRSYIERFNKEAVQVDVTDDMKKYLMRKNLRDGTKFKEMVAIEKPATWDEILYKAQAYMQFEEETMADAMRYSRAEDNRPPREQGNKNGYKRNGDRRGRVKSREPRGPPSQFTNYTPLLVPREIVLAESRYCAYHKSYGHLTEDCIQLKDAIEILIRNGKLKDYVKRKENPRQEKKREDTPEDEPRASGEKNVALAVWRPEDFYVPKHLKDTYEHLILNEWKIFAETMVISGGVFDKHTVGSVKRKFEELITASSGMVVTLGKPKTSSQPLSFYLEELSGGSANSQIPLFVRADMVNFDVRRILVDSGSSCDIMYTHLFRTLHLDESHLTPYLGSDLQGFNGATTKPWGYVDLIVTFGHNETAKSIKVKFLVVDCPSLYQCIIGRTAIADLPAVASAAHLKMKYYTDKGHVATLHGDIEAARRCFNAAYKGQSYVGPVPEAKKSKTSSEQPKTSTKPPPSQPPQNVSLVDLDSRHSKQEHKDEKKLRKDKTKGDAASRENLRLIPDEDFELIPLGEDPSKNLKIGKDVPDLARKQLVACLKDNVDLFAWGASEMPGFDPSIACHQLTVDEAASAVVQRRHRQSPEKMEAAEKAIKDLLEANFISKAKACPKDAYRLPCIDRLVDNSSGFKLLSFLDAYSGYNQIPMVVADRTKTAFMTESGNYYYNVMPFGLKNVGATYQRMMNKVFRGEIGDMLEVYMDDMIVKSHDEVDHTVHLQKVFEQARKVNMRFNPEKCTFGIRAGKFLDFYLTERGIEVNPDKCQAFTEFPTPNDKKSIQTLNGMLTALSRFVPKSAQHALPLFKLLRKESAFEWTEECEQALQHLKKALSEPPVLLRLEVGEVLYLYLAVASEAVSATLIRETLERQKPVYFTSKALQGPELRYQRIEKVGLAPVTAARRLRYYFLAHTIVLRTDQPIKSLLVRPDMAGRMLKWSLELSEFDIRYESRKALKAQPIKSLLVRPDMAGRMLKWSLELSEFDIRYESRKALKAQVLADFVAEMTCSSSSTDGANKWTIFVDGASNATGAGTGIILENEEGILIEVSLEMSFPTSNNQAEYEAFLAGLRLAEDERITKFDSAEIQHVPREHNKRANILSKLASTKRKNGNKSVIQEILSHPRIQKPTRVLDINVIGDANYWMTPVYNYLAHGTLPSDENEAATVKRRVCSYTLLDNKLYRRGFSIPLLKCADEATADYILREIHEGINSQHLGGRSLARKALRAGYYWPTMQQDAKEHVKKCDKCQRHGDMHLAPPHELKSLSSPWPFAWWGMDILGPFTRGNLQCRYLIVGMDYFTKWVEAEPLPEITSFRILRFFKRDILCRFGIPQAVVTDNGTQFTDKTFRGFLAKINTKHHFTSVEHPQTNVQAEAANRVILRGLRRRLGDAKKQWVEELPHVLWAYRTTPHSTTGETPFRLAYGTEAVISVEIGEPSRRTEAPLDEEMNDKAMREELDLHLLLKQRAELLDNGCRAGTRANLKTLKVNSELSTRVEPLPDENNSGNELHRHRAVT
ncbi:hypothetical protein TSUD_317240 [Trifolium subterraneum]|uniref:Integrase catalytic domain-containing protein n=2 Tax=Trifolium TaxID=3898 RepID=A0A2Z6NRC5_TRISU|nr:hypothetical protein TSUD_317240 [Trifolium subterraneum]